MPRKIPPLTTAKINAAKPKDKRYKLSDGEGLQLWVKPSGTKTWIFEYTRADKKRVLMSFGSYPELGLAEAREARLKARSQLLAGLDPQDERESERKSRGEAFQEKEVEYPFREVAELWKQHWSLEKDPRYVGLMWRRLEADAFPELGDKAIKTITAKMIIDALRPMEERGVLESARRVRGAIEDVFSFALARGIVENNVAAGTSKAFGVPKKKNFRALSPDKLPDLVKALHSDKLGLVTRMVALWQLLTLSRPGEAVQTQWSEIDEEKKIWTIPAEKMKKRRKHVVPLSVQALNVLDIMRDVRSDDYVFPGQGGRGHTHREVIRMGLKRLDIDSTAHGFRSLASTIMNESGLFSPDIIEVSLAHIDRDKVRAAYNRAEYFEQRRKLMDWWGGLVAAHDKKRFAQLDGSS